MPHIRSIILDYLDQQSGKAVLPADAVITQCDLAYSRWLIGEAPFPDAAAWQAFIDLLSDRELAGTSRPGAIKVNVHSTAYALGVLNLMAAEHGAAINEHLGAANWQWSTLISPQTLIPKWPAKYTHHSWRVSHWIGGTASIIASLWKLSPDLAAKMDLPRPLDVLEACDRLIDARSGLFRTYKSAMIQKCFRMLYRLRHDPDAGDVGGIVHLHWVNYALGRMPYKAADQLFERAWALMQKVPFMEKVPYCLDFDIVQIVRTASMKRASEQQVLLRARKYGDDIVGFFEHGVPDSYTLHKLPGALATLHECALMTEDRHVQGLGIEPRDIMKAAYWI